MLLPWIEEYGIGVYCESERDIARAARLDPKPFRKNVFAHRDKFAMEKHVGALAELYESVLS